MLIQPIKLFVLREPFVADPDSNTPESRPYEDVTIENPLPVTAGPLLPGNNLENSPTNSTSIAYEASHLVKSDEGTVFGFTVYNSKASTQFILLMDAKTLPIDGQVPAIPYAIPAASNLLVDFGVYGRRFNNGIVICNSSTGPTKTIGSADCWFDVQFT